MARPRSECPLAYDSALCAPLDRWLCLATTIVAVVAVAYVLAPGTPAVGYLGDPVSDGTLKLTDTMLNLTYFLFGGALLALVAGWVIGATRK